MADKRVILSDPLTQDRLFPAVIADNIFNADGTPFDLEGLKTSVSEGKSLIAAAVTDKGVETAADATFQTMAENIGKIEENFTYLPITMYRSISMGTSSFQNTETISVESSPTNKGISITQEMFDTMSIVDANNLYFSNLQSGFASNGNWYKCRYDVTNAYQSLGYTARYGNGIRPLPLYPYDTMTPYTTFTLSKYNFIDTMSCTLVGEITKSTSNISIPMSYEYTATMGGSLTIFAFIKVKF